MNINISPLGIWLFGFFAGIASVVGVMLYLSYHLQRMKNQEDSERFTRWLGENGPDLLEVLRGAEDECGG